MPAHQQHDGIAAQHVILVSQDKCKVKVATCWPLADAVGAAAVAYKQMGLPNAKVKPPPPSPAAPAAATPSRATLVRKCSQPST